MTTFRYSVCFALAGLSASAQDVAVPSGTAMTLYDVIIEANPAVARFRFLAPEIGEDGKGYADLAQDFQYLCDSLVEPSLSENGWSGDDVVISVSASEVAFGEINPDVLQFFQPFTLSDGRCIWEDY